MKATHDRQRRRSPPEERVEGQGGTGVGGGEQGEEASLEPSLESNQMWPKPAGGEESNIFKEGQGKI